LTYFLGSEYAENAPYSLGLPRSIAGFKGATLWRRKREVKRKAGKRNRKERRCENTPINAW